MSVNTLNREELVSATEQLAKKLARFLPFKSCTIYFAERPLETPELLSRERCLIAPVNWQETQVAQVRLEQVGVKAARKVLPLLPEIISLCVENIFLEQRRHRDEVTGLLTEGAFLVKMAERMQPSAETPLHERCFGLVVIVWQNGQLLRQRAGGYTVGTVFAHMTRDLRRMLPPDALASCLGIGEWRHEMAVLLPGRGRGFCQGFARRVLQTLAAREIVDPFSGGRVKMQFSAGHAIFPQDMGGGDLHKDAFSQALLLKDRALLAARAASQRGNDALAYGWILARGGIIQEVLADNRVRVTLGGNCQARVGMRFQILAQGRESKGQLILRQVTPSSALADIVFLSHVDDPPLPGDGLALIHQEQTPPASFLLSQESFNVHFKNEARQLRHFALSITRISPGKVTGASLPAFLDSRLSRLAEISDADIIMGAYEPSGIIILWPRPEEATRLLEDFHIGAREAGFMVASGIVSYPFLDIGREEMEQACLKALEYGQLLPFPHIGVLDAVALTISGDKYFSWNDKLGAADEYRRALLLKPNDALIMNSYGVCLAALNRLESAAHVFEQALDNCGDAGLRAKICYNLANVYQKENNLREARHFYRQCLRADASHMYAWLRLGQIEEMAGKVAGARALYTRARDMARDDRQLASLAQRFLAKLEAGVSQPERARELLHDALLRNPNDSAALLLLAETYLEEDAAMAELLARKAARLGANAHAVLARALEAQGRLEESRLVQRRD